MKKLIFTLFFIGVSTYAAFTQLVINEIMYNSPDGGNDSIEFIELYNNSDVMLNLSGYSFTEGVNYTFPNINLPSGAFLVLTNDSLAMLNNFGITAFEWTSGALNNTGEDIEIIDAAANIVDFVDYSESLPWPISADGDGPSLELCNPNQDNAGPGSWAASTNATGAIISGVEILATPGAINSNICPQPDVMVNVSNFLFDPSNITIFVGQTVEWTNTEGNHNVNGSQTTFPTNPESFFSGPVTPAPWTFSYTFNTVGNYNYQCDQHVGLGMVGTVTVLPAPPDDIVITEILYNIPGVGNNFDFIELYNRGDNAVNLEGYRFIQGIDHVFSNLSLAAGDYLVLCEDASAFNAVFGGNAISWNSGGLNDNGEDLTLVDATGNLIDFVPFNDNDPWPEITDGEGPSLIVCNPDEDNGLAENWSFSTTNTGIVSGGSGNLIYASPGAANANCTDAPHIFFENGLEDVDEGAMSITIELLLANTGMNDTADVELMIMPSSTASDGFDFTLSSNMVSFSPDGPGGLSTGTFDIFVLDDTDIEGSETIVLTLKNPTNGTVIASTGEMVITIVDNDGLDPEAYPLYEIQEVTTLDSLNLPDSIDVQCELRGVVYGSNLRPEGLVFFMVDKNDNDDGIGVISTDNNFGYNLQEGDEVAVLGRVDHFNGWNIIRADSVRFLSANNPLFDPEFITELDEDTENKLVRINNLSVVSQTTTGTTGVNYIVTDGVNEYLMRVDADIDLAGMALPNKFDAIGMGNQFDEGTVPLDSFYQFLPRYKEDILALVNTEDLGLEKDIRFYPNPTHQFLTIETDVELDEIRIHNVLGQELKVWRSINGVQVLNVEDLLEGTYFLNFRSETMTWTSSFIKH
ncbi:MAG: lamin tail domain-containing protein [Bacteroidota bacterium]